MQRNILLGGMAMLLLTGSGTWAADPRPFDVLIENDNAAQPFTAPLPGPADQLIPRPFLIGDPIQPMQNRTPSEYWLGVECYPVPTVLRVHLNLSENQGLVVGSVIPESPAAKAGLETNDLLMMAGETKLTSVQDLSKVVEAAKKSPLTFEIIHAGKAKAIEVTPAERPQNMMVKQQGSSADWKEIEKWMQKMQNGENANQPQQLHFRVFQPGAILPPGAPIQLPMPNNMSININRNGDKPADITVKWNDKKWEGTEKNLDELPADVRPYVERMLGRGKVQMMTFGAGGAGSASAEALGFATPGPSPDAQNTPAPQTQAQPSAPLEDRLDDISRKIDRLQNELQALRTERHPSVQIEKNNPQSETKPAEEPAK